MNQLMRNLSTIALLCLMVSGLSAQEKDTLGLPPTPPGGDLLGTSGVTVFYGLDTLSLSRTPTVKELVRIFASVGKGRLDPFVALPAVIAKGDSAVAALDTILFTDPIAEIVHRTLPVGVASTSGTPEVLPPDDTVRPNKLYAAMALEGLASKASYSTIFLTAQRHPNADVRGIALRALASSFHEADRLENFTPDKQLVHLLLSNVDDTTTVPYLEKSFGQIAREGLITWLGQDFGEPQGKIRRLRDAAGGDNGTLAEYRQAWWLSNGGKIIWDNQSRSFHLK